MRIRPGVCLLILVCLLYPQSIGLAFNQRLPDLPLEESWGPVIPGIDLQVYRLNNPVPVKVYVARMDRNNLTTTIESSIAQGSIAEGRETITGMAARQNQAINYWGETWGARNRVVVAINGYFFDGSTGTPWSGVAHSGWYTKRFDDFIGDAGFAWTVNRTAHIGACVYHIGAKNKFIFKNTGYDPSLRGINLPAGNGELILYTPQYAASTRTSSPPGDPVLEFLVEMTRPSLVLPSPAMATGYIREINDRIGSTPIPFDHVVLSAWGSVRTTMLDKISVGEIAVGDEIGVSQEISDCASSPSQNWTKTYASIGGDYHFLNNGVIRTDFNNSDAFVRNSRTAIAFNDNFIFFIVVDAFDPDVSEGLNIAQLADFVKNVLGAIWGVTLDSGTSSTMVVNGEVINNTYCNFTRDCGMQLGNEVQKLQDPVVLPPEMTYKTEWDDISGALEPLVGSGMLMVISEPIVRSYSFVHNQTVATIVNTPIHLGPGNNYDVITTIPSGRSGIVMPHLNHLEGVLAKGSFWWKVNFGDVNGWVREEHLQGGGIPSSYKLYLPIMQRLSSAILLTKNNIKDGNVHSPSRDSRDNHGENIRESK